MHVPMSRVAFTYAGRGFSQAPPDTVAVRQAFSWLNAQALAKSCPWQAFNGDAVAARPAPLMEIA